jgi:ATP synthase protein I
MKPKNENQQISRGYHFAMRIATELVAATLIGCAMGYGLDKWLGTWPWLFLVFFLFGVIAGFLNVYRAVTPGYTRTFDPNGNP